MKIDEFKESVKSILESDIKFDGHVDLVINSLQDHRQKSILDWIKECKLSNIKPEPCKNFKEFISFIYKSNDNKIRGILTKEKNSYFIELFLDNHKYYDRKRRYLGL